MLGKGCRCFGCLAGLICAGLVFLGGCPNVIPEQAVEVALGNELGSFDVPANSPVRKSGIIRLDTGGINLGRGSLEIAPDVIEFTPAEQTGGKHQVTLQATNTFEVTIWVASADQVEMVFDVGDEYGPFEVTLNDANEPVAVNPSRVTLSGGTIDLIESGEFSIGIEAVSTVDGSITIASLTFNLGL
jgi:hypothetical protein